MELLNSQVWGQTNNASAKKVFLLQKAAMRIITFSDFRAHTNSLFKENNILKFQDYVTLENRLFIFDFLKRLCRLALTTTLKHSKKCTLQMSVPGTLNQVTFLYHVLDQKKYGLNSFKRNAINAWNMFTNVFRDDQSINRNGVVLLHYSRNELKKKITTYFLNSY